MIIEKRKTIRQSVYNRDFAVNDWGKIPIKKERIEPLIAMAFAFEVIVLAIVFAGYVS